MERTQPLVAGAITALVGFTSSFTIVLAGLRAVGASERQAASGLFTVCVIMGILAIWAGVRTHIPVSIAWSTPGAALLLATGMPDGGFGTAVCAFLVRGCAIILTGLIAPLRGLILAIPKPIANALLAGVLLELCLVPVTTVRHQPGLALPIVLTWLILFRLARRWAVPAAMLVALTEIVARAGDSRLGDHSIVASLTFTAPHLSVQAVTLGLSLFIVTMASQNVPGIAVLDGFGYPVPVRGVLLETGIGTVVGATLGGHVVNLAAISAALCAGPDAHPDRDRRWVASAFAGFCYLTFGFGAAILSALVAVAPAGLVETVAGLALLGTLGASLAAATQQVLDGQGQGCRDAAVVTFLVTASGVSIGGIGSALWGLAAGLVMLATQSLSFPRRARINLELAESKSSTVGQRQ
ncbi:benzoate/H(+) symporter BenE family transporter [Jatrophihabitans sp. DSM 45814]